jgi:hypothetical protein
VVSPFAIDGPATISFSGGRTSGYMLRRILDEGIRADVHVLFANTGKERPETLEFIHAVETRWGVPIHWLEYRAEPKDDGLAHTYAEVTHEAASRAGEPFAALIEARSYLPNPVTRFCTQELKIRVMQKWAMTHGFDHWTNVVGIRADEPRRVAKMGRANETGANRYEVALPLAEAGILLADVAAFWSEQPFDLRLMPWEGNCDLCFLKGRDKKERIIRDDESLATWWIEQENRLTDSSGRPARFRADAVSYAAMVRRVRGQPLLPMVEADEIDDLGDCICHD